MLFVSRTLEKPDPCFFEYELPYNGPVRFLLEYSPMNRGRKREATALNDGAEAAKMATFVSITDQYMAPLITYVASGDESMGGTKVIRTIDEMQALENELGMVLYP